MMAAPPAGAGRRAGSGPGPLPLRTARRAALAAAAALALGAPQGAGAQEEAPAPQVPNPLLTFGFAQRLEADTNPELASDGGTTRTQVATDLSLAYADETPISALTLSALGTLRLVYGDGSDGDGSLDGLVVDGPVLRFGYRRAVPSSSVAVSAEARRDEVAFLRGIEDFVDEDGTVDLPEDFEDLEGVGARRSATLDAAVTLRDDRPLGFTLSTGLDVVDYVDTTAADLEDSRRTDLSAGVRLDLTPAAQVNATLGASSYEEDDGDGDTTLGFDLEGTIERPLGAVFARLELDDTDDGLRAELTFGRDLALPLGGISASLGAVRDATGEVRLAGSVSATRESPRGVASLALDQSVRTGDDDAEELVTTVSARLTRELTPLASLSLDALYAGTDSTGTDESDRNLELGATLSRDLTRDWSLDLGYRRRLREESDDARATGDSVFLTVGRTFDGGL